jgi:hypothetical protein
MPAMEGHETENRDPAAAAANQAAGTLHHDPE